MVTGNIWRFPRIAALALYFVNPRLISLNRLCHEGLKISFLTLCFLFAFLNTNAQFSEYTVQKLSNDQFGFTEGPAWDGNNLYFSNIPEGNIYKYNSDDGFQLFLDNPFSTNGIVYSEGLLYICESGTGRVITVDTFGNYLDVLADTYQGDFLNSPNDLALDGLGGVYFTDPAFGFEPLITESVYYIEPEGELKRILTGLIKPNGILYNSSKKQIYISDTYDRFVFSYQLDSPGIISDTIEFAELKIAGFRDDDYSGADGMCFDKNGFLYVSTEIGIQIFDRQGNAKGILAVPETPTNCIFGGKNYDELYITAQKNIYRVKLELDQNNTGLLFHEKITAKEIKYFPGSSSFMVNGIRTECKFIIYNILGKICYSDYIMPGEMKTVNLDRGVYILSVNDENKRITKKIILK